MTPTSPVPARYTDTRRNAERYDILVAELDEASKALRLEGRELETVEATLTRLLPHLCDALNGQSAFLAEVTAGDLAANMAGHVLAAHKLNPAVVGKQLPWSPLLQKLQGRPRAVVDDNRRDAGRRLIPGLEMFEATSAVVVRLQMGGRRFLIGVCNREKEYLGPFLAYDRKILESLSDLFSIGIELGERRKQDLESILEAGLKIKVESGQDEQLRIIAERAGSAFFAPVSIMLWDEARAELVIRAAVGLSDEYRRGQRVQRERVEELYQELRGKRSDVNLQLPRVPYGARKLIAQAGLTGVLYTCLVVDGTLEGVLNIYSTKPKPQFSQREWELAGIFASQAEQVIHNARMYERLADRNKHIEAVNKASKRIISDVGKGRKDLMLGVLHDAVETISAAKGARATVGVLLLERDGALVFESIYPPGLESMLNMPTGEQLPLMPRPGQKRSISVRAFLSMAPQCVADVSVDSDYYTFCDDTLSELAVPLFERSPSGSGEMRPMGVLNLESNRRDTFDNDDVEALQALADLAVIALRNVDQSADLARTRTVAYMGAWAASLAHDFHHAVGQVRRKIDLLRTDPALPEALKQQVELIDSLAGGLSMPELPEMDYQLSAHGRHQTKVPVDRLLENLLIPLCDDLKDAEIVLEGGCRDEIVLMEEEWINLILRHLVNNAAESFVEGAGPRALRIGVRTMLFGDFVRVEVCDNGPGVPREKEKDLFQTLAPLTTRGGRGLPLVQFLVEYHGGKIELSSNRPGEGACFTFTLMTLQAALRRGVD